MSITHLKNEILKLFFEFENNAPASVNHAITDVEQAVSAGLQFLKDNVPATVIALGEEVLAGAVAGTPWGALVSSLVAAAESKGVALLESAASVALNFAQSNLIATGTGDA